MTLKANDRRRAQRAPAILSVEYESTATSEGVQTHDVSSTGLFLGTKTPLPVGTILELRLGEGPSHLRVRVARVVEPDVSGKRAAGMGCLILEADDAATQALAKELARTPPQQVRSVVVDDGPWPAAVPFAPRRASSDTDAPAAPAKAAESTAETARDADAGSKPAPKKDRKKQKGGKA